MLHLPYFYHDLSLVWFKCLTVSIVILLIVNTAGGVYWLFSGGKLQSRCGLLTAGACVRLVWRADLALLPAVHPGRRGLCRHVSAA